LKAVNYVTLGVSRRAPRILRVRAGHGHFRRLDNFTCRPAVDRRNVMAERRRFPPPLDIEEANAACFIVKNNNGQALAYVYFEDEPGRRSAANLLTRDEAQRIAANIAKLPQMLKWDIPSSWCYQDA
jgi:hypothetical protein